MRHVVKNGRHFCLSLEVLLRREAFRSALIGENVALGDAHARLVRAKFIAGQELHWVRRDDRQRELGSESHGCRGQRVIVGVASALHFEIIAVAKKLCPRRGRLGSAGSITLGKRLANIAAGESGHRDETRGAFGEPSARELGATAMLVAAISPC